MQYRNGTISINNGSAVVNGVGTEWSARINAGALLALPGHAGTYTVLSVESDTQLTLTTPWQGANLTAARYWITTDFTPFNNLPLAQPTDLDATKVIERAMLMIDQKLTPTPMGLFAVLDKDLTVPPLSPANGAAYIVPAGAIGAWAGKTSKIAIFQQGSWLFYTPSNAAWLKVQDEGKFYFYDLASNTWAINPMAAEAATKVSKAGDSMQGPLRLSGGAFNAPSLTFSGDTDTGIYRPAADTIGVAVGGSQALEIRRNGSVNETVVRGDLIVEGRQVIQNTTVVEIDDNILLLNKDVTGAPTENAGIEIERGAELNAQLLWDEGSDFWRAGVAGAMRPIAFTEEAPIADALPFWNAATRRFQTSSAIVTDGTDIFISGGRVLTTATLDISTKLDASAYTAADVLAKFKTVDGSGSGADADLLDGQHGSYYRDWNNLTNAPTYLARLSDPNGVLLRNTTSFGYIDMGVTDVDTASFITGSSKFAFNAPIHINGNVAIHAGNIGDYAAAGTWASISGKPAWIDAFDPATKASLNTDVGFNSVAVTNVLTASQVQAGSVVAGVGVNSLLSTPDTGYFRIVPSDTPGTGWDWGKALNFNRTARQWEVGTDAIWHAGNFNPATKATLGSFPTFSQLRTSYGEGGVAGTVYFGNGDKYLDYNGSNYSLVGGALYLSSPVFNLNNVNAAGPNFVSDTTNKDANDYGFVVRRSGQNYGGITNDGRGMFALGSAVGGNAIWHAGNFNPGAKLNITDASEDVQAGRLVKRSANGSIYSKHVYGEDFIASRGNGSGCVYFGGTSAYLFYDGSVFNFNGPIYSGSYKVITEYTDAIMNTVQFNRLMLRGGYTQSVLNPTLDQATFFGSSSIHQGGILADILAFNPPSNTRWTTDNGATWTSITTPKGIFKGMVASQWGGFNIPYAVQKVQFTWAAMGYRFMDNFLAACSTNGNYVVFKFEKSTDGVTWLPYAETTSTSTWPGYITHKLEGTPGGEYGWFRITVTRTQHNGNDVTIGALSIPGSYGGSSPLFTWDADKNFTLQGGRFYNSSGTYYYHTGDFTLDVNASNDSVVKRNSGGYVYAQWFGVSSGGLFSNTTGAHFKQEAAGWTAQSGLATTTTLNIQTNDGVIRGRFYGDSGGNFGLLDSSGNWRLQVNPAGDVFIKEGGSTTRQVLHAGGVPYASIRKGAVGVYSASNTQAIWAMGEAYKLSDNGNPDDYGGHYGLAWSYNPDYAYAGNNPQSKPGLNHQMLLQIYGVTQTAIGTGIWTIGNIRGMAALEISGTGLFHGALTSYGNIASAGVIIASPTAGFKTASYTVNGPSRFMCLGTAEGYGISYFQGSSGWNGGDTIGFHFGDNTVVAGSQHRFRSNGDAFHSNHVYMNGGVQASGASNFAGQVNFNGTNYFASWVRVSGGAGLYFESYGRGLVGADANSSYGNVAVYGAGLNGWQGISLTTGNNTILMANGSSVGIYNPQTGVWLQTSDMSGNVTFAGNVTAYSDERLKDNKRPIDRITERRDGLAAAAILYERDGRTRFGYGAQTLRRSNPEAVHEADDARKHIDGTGTLSVDYGETAAVLAVASKMTDDRVAELTNEVAALKVLVEKLIGEKK